MPTIDLVAKVGRALATVARAEPDGATTSAVAHRLDLPRASVHRLLHSLLAEGLVDRTPDTARWVLGPEAYLLGVQAAPRYDVSVYAQPIVRRLADATGEGAFYSTRRGDETVCLVAEEGSFPLRSHVLHPGKRFHLGVASAGLVILALLEVGEARRYLETHDLVADFGDDYSAPALGRRLAKTRRTGYAVNPGLVVPGSWGIAAGVSDPSGRPVGALSLTGVETRFTRARIPELGATLLRSAHELTGLLAPARPRNL